MQIHSFLDQRQFPSFAKGQGCRLTTVTFLYPPSPPLGHRHIRRPRFLPRTIVHPRYGNCKFCKSLFSLFACYKFLKVLKVNFVFRYKCWQKYETVTPFPNSFFLRLLLHSSPFMVIGSSNKTPNFSPPPPSPSIAPPTVRHLCKRRSLREKEAIFLNCLPED